MRLFDRLKNVRFYENLHAGRRAPATGLWPRHILENVKAMIDAGVSKEKIEEELLKQLPTMHDQDFPEAVEALELLRSLKKDPVSVINDTVVAEARRRIVFTDGTIQNLLLAEKVLPLLVKAEVRDQWVKDCFCTMIASSNKKHKRIVMEHMSELVVDRSLTLVDGTPARLLSEIDTIVTPLPIPNDKVYEDYKGYLKAVLLFLSNIPAAEGVLKQFIADHLTTPAFWELFSAEEYVDILQRCWLCGMAEEERNRPRLRALNNELSNALRVGHRNYNIALILEIMERFNMDKDIDDHQLFESLLFPYPEAKHYPGIAKALELAGKRESIPRERMLREYGVGLCIRRSATSLAGDVGTIVEKHWDYDGALLVLKGLIDYGVSLEEYDKVFEEMLKNSQDDEDRRNYQRLYPQGLIMMAENVIARRLKGEGVIASPRKAGAAISSDDARNFFKLVAEGISADTDSLSISLGKLPAKYRPAAAAVAKGLSEGKSLHTVLEGVVTLNAAEKAVVRQAEEMDITLKAAFLRLSGALPTPAAPAPAAAAQPAADVSVQALQAAEAAA